MIIAFGDRFLNELLVFFKIELVVMGIIIFSKKRVCIFSCVGVIVI